MLDVGGRPWFGSSETVAPGRLYYQGFLHRDNVIYPFSFLRNGGLTDDREWRQVLAAVRLLPGVPLTASSQWALSALDRLEEGSLDPADPSLSTLFGGVGGENWLLPYFLGRLAEQNGDFTTAKTYYLAAHSAFPGDV
jgi:hypothetical protein